MKSDTFRVFKQHWWAKESDTSHTRAHTHTHTHTPTTQLPPHKKPCLPQLVSVWPIENKMLHQCLYLFHKSFYDRNCGQNDSIWNGSQNRKEQAHDQQHHSADISTKGYKLDEVTSFKYLRATLCKDSTCSAEVCIRIASAVAAMARLNRIWQCNTIHLCKQVQALQVPSYYHSPLQLWNIDPAYWLWDKDPGFQNQVLEETSPHLLLGAQGQWLSAAQDQLPCDSSGISSSKCQRDRNLHGSSILHAMAASLKPSFRAPWRVCNTMVSGENAGRTSKSGHICQC